MLPKIIDLFSGCGGLTLGFEKAGFNIVGGIELMPEACRTISYNTDFRYGRDQTHLCGDITNIDAEVFLNRFGDEGCIVIGGPPCQAYSKAGKAKLKSLGENRINTIDARGFLYRDFLRFVYDLDANAAIMENVPEATNYGNMNIPEIVCEDLENHGYDAYWTILNAADFGVPQIRERVFVFGIKKNLNKKITLPIPSHKSSDGFQTTIQKRMVIYDKNLYFRMPNKSEKALKTWVTVKDAISDLPVLSSGANINHRFAKLNEERDYRCEPLNEYQKLMRTWYGPECISVTANAYRNNKRYYDIFSKMKQGDDYLSASRIADELFKQEANVFGFKPGTKEYENLKKKMVPVYDRSQFIKKWVRLCEDKPSHTLTAHLSNDTYSHIHPVEPRGISVREAARIQSFPDDFFFDCNMGDAFKQIGNAVPPLLAYAIANRVYMAFQE